MRTIVHVSDLHFGRTHASRVEALRAYVLALEPQVVAVSGDLTMRARTAEFAEARAFLDTLPKPQVVVPGNHDVPLYDLYARFFQPFAKYQRLFHPELEPFLVDEEIAICGLNSARGRTVKGGRLDEAQVREAVTRLSSVPSDLVKIVVTHHPFDLPPGHDETDILGGAREAMDALAAVGADVFLAGHIHATHTKSSFERYRIAGHSALVVQAGTATSTRTRGEVNAFNVLHVDRASITVEHVCWREDDFATTNTARFARQADGWYPA